MRTIKEVNEGLAQAGIPAFLTKESAIEVTENLGRSKFIEAIKEATRGNENARRWIEVNLSRLGILEEGNARFPNDTKQNQERGGKAQESANASRSGNGNGNGEREFLSHHVYGSDALCFEATESRSGFFTIQVDGAKRADGRRKNWGEKITIQITASEFPVVARLFLGGAGKVEFSAHGPQNDKGFSIERQKENLYFTMRAKGKPVVGVPITPADQAHVAALFIRQWMQNYPWLDSTTAMLMLKQGGAS